MDWTITWTNSLQTAFNQLAAKVGAFLPNVIFAILLLLTGWIIASALGRLVKRALETIGVQKMWDELGFDDLFRNVGVNLRISNLAGWMVKWFLILVFLVAAADILNMPQISAFIDQVAAYIPNVIAATVIVFIGIVAGNALAEAAERASIAANIVPPHLIGNFVRLPIFTFAVLAALSQLQIATDMVRILFSGIVFAMSLALGLAFGLGGRDEAKRILEQMSTKAASTPRIVRASAQPQTRRKRR